MMKVIDFGLRDYGEVLELQTSLFEQLIQNKKEKKEGQEFILIGEHPPVITLGRRAKEENLLFSEDYLKEKGVSLYHIGRGGDITYHCPGQLIVYPILDLEKHKLGVKDYVNLLEESVIRLLYKYGITGERIEGATGVWLGKGTPDERKISAIGIKCTRFCTMHGLSLNVNADLSGFSFINPCGFKDKGVTGINLENLEKSGCPEVRKSDQTPKRRQEEETTRPDFERIKQEFLDIFLSLVFPFEEVLDFPEKL